MSLNDPLASALSLIFNAEKVGKKECIVKPSSKVIKLVFDIMKENQYLGEYREVTDKRGNYLLVNLIGKVNRCGVIKPRFPVTVGEYEKFEKRFLPAKDFGILIVSTSKGIMIHNKSKEKNLGGKLLAYCY